MEKDRVLLKISGESFGSNESPYNRANVLFMAKEIQSINGICELAIVVGGGNFPRGRELKENFFERDTIVADWMGMQATISNAIALQEILENDFRFDTRVMSTIETKELCEPYIVRKALSHLRKGRIIILAGGLGIPGFSTDTTMVMRAYDLRIKTVYKGTKVAGIYDKDPIVNEDAKFLKDISHMDFLTRSLRIIDSTAVTQAQNHGIEIKIFHFFEEGNLRRVLVDKDIGSTIH